LRCRECALRRKLHARRLRLIGLYEEQGISRERVLIKARTRVRCRRERAALV
jgi:hypothetical protein